MRCLGTFVVLFCLAATSLGRPSESSEPVENVQEVEYDSEEESNNEDSLRDEDNSRLNKQEPTYDQEEDQEAILKPINAEEKRDVPAQSDERSSKDKSDASPDYKLSGDRESDDMKPIDAFQPNRPQRPIRFTKETEANDQTEMVQQTANINAPNREQLVRRAAFRRGAKTTTDDKSDDLFENAVVKENTFKMNNRPSFKDLTVDHEGLLRNYYKTLLQNADDKAKLEDKNFENFPSNFYRNRRQTQAMDLLDNNLKSKDKNTLHENEETAIKKHIEKLSEQELDDLINSLPDEKRALLNKIIESEKSHYDNLSKRDITKKAGAVEENNDIDSAVFDSSKVQGGTSVDIKNDAGSNTETTENTKPPDFHTEISEVSSPKKTSSQEQSYDKGASANLVENKLSTKLSDDFNNAESKIQVNAESNDQSLKINSKRETDIKDLENEESSFRDANLLNDFNPDNLNNNENEDISGGGFQGEDSSQLVSNDDQSENSILDHINKREAFQENSDSFKSLEDSFPNSNAYKESGQYSELDMVPLVRVKRKNAGSLITKRNANQVAYIPYRAENDDDDSEEGNEFDDDGFYDRSSSYAKNIDNSQSTNDNLVKIQAKEGKTAEHADISRDENIESSDTMNIGSDTDSVLSGVEGVDDNLMFNSGSRNRRTAEKKPTDTEDNDSRHSSLIDAESKRQSNNLDLPNYQENDAFGPLPRNYEGDLNRLKRIRRVRPDNVSSNSDEQSNTH